MPGPSANRQRAAPFRDDRHYFHRRTWIGAWRVRLAVLALLLAAGWVAARMIDPERRYGVATHGPLVQAHARWADQCDACHVPHTGDVFSGLFDTHDRWHTFRCETCHAGPANDPKNYGPHFDQAKPQAVHDCSICHHDHQGTEFAITRVSDSECVRCHKDLSPLHGNLPSVTAFDTVHPEFRAKAKPPTRGLKFNHGLHLAAGLTEAGNLRSPNAAFHLGQIDPAYRELYRRFAGDSDIIRLDCTACHEPVGGGYKPILFDRHCQGCHAQTISGLQSPAGVTTKPFTVPHGKPAAEVERFIRSELLRQIDEQKKILQTVPLPPNDRLDAPPTPVPSDLAKEAGTLTKLAAGLLSCQKCHTMADGSVKPTNTPQGWLSAAQFDHTAHRAVECATCHQTWAQAPFVREAGPEPLNIPGIDTCRICHAPIHQRDGTTVGGARYDCVSCHRYHHP
jgi:predicted CXXCH cytochrome family protein